MIILSYNSRGLGRGIKWAAIRRLNLIHKIDLVCIQETKREKFDKIICQSMWGDSTVSWDSVPFVHAVGGLLCLWNNSAFQVERTIKCHSFLFLDGTWVTENQRLHIVNVYAPCDLPGKRILWEELRQLKLANPNGVWCFLGNFNSIRSQEERIGSSQRGADIFDISEFNAWISNISS